MTSQLLSECSLDHVYIGVVSRIAYLGDVYQFELDSETCVWIHTVEEGAGRSVNIILRTLPWSTSRVKRRNWSGYEFAWLAECRKQFSTWQPVQQRPSAPPSSTQWKIWAKESKDTTLGGIPGQKEEEIGRVGRVCRRPKNSSGKRLSWTAERCKGTTHAPELPLPVRPSSGSV